MEQDPERVIPRSSRGASSNMHESPRLRRLRNDLKVMQALQEESSIFRFYTPGSTFEGGPENYVLHFHGTGLWRPEGTIDVLPRFEHEVRIHLGASYPRMMPELTWKTPIFHPNISASGIVCLGGYGTHWAPSLQLDELARMLWEMVRYANYDVNSPYNREAAYWVKAQTRLRFPVDPRPLRDRLQVDPSGSRHGGLVTNRPDVRVDTPAAPEVQFLDSKRRPEIVDAEIIDDPRAMSMPDIVFID